ncbi:MAG: hypothetical protein IJW97_08360 [Clostridia bacterium]|nr:hypothetical protein [Clostridia bacterium]
MTETNTPEKISEIETQATETAVAPAEEQAPQEKVPYTPKKRRRRRGDRRDGRLLHDIPAMPKLMPYIMINRSDACNTFSDALDITKADQYCRSKVRAGQTGFSMLHLFLAAYVRLISQYPAINRFVSGQRIYARRDIEFVMTIKKSMSIDSEDTCIKVKFDPTDTPDEVYAKFNAVVEANKQDANEKNDFDVFIGKMAALPRWMLRIAAWALRKLDYHGMMPASLLDGLPFYGSMIITSMGSLGIRPIYHHIYDFGNLPVFLSYGTKYTRMIPNADGTMTKKKFIDLKVVTDERICDGYYYASAFKALKKYIENPEILDTPPAEVFEDVD